MRQQSILREVTIVRALVLSDSHNRFETVHTAVDAHPEADLILHLGDGLRELEDIRMLYPKKRILAVTGNCDWVSLESYTRTVELGGKVLFFAHGHTFGVKSDIQPFLDAARNAGADIALFGHTHIPVTGYQDGLYYMNPGSLGRPLRGAATYGLVDVTPAGIALHVAELERGRAK